MAGFGGLLNYEKPGPGIDKDAPKKKGIALFFSIVFEKFWKLIPLSFLYWLFALPVVTIGFADVGIAYITRNFTREKPVFLAADYFGTIKKNWKQALTVGIVNLLLTVALVFGMWFYYSAWEASFVYKVGFVILACMLIVFTFLKYYINLLIVTFDLSFKQLYKNSLLLSSVGLKENVIITVGLLLVYAVLIGLPFLFLFVLQNILGMVITLIFTILFLPALQALIVQFCVFPVVKKHMIDPYYKANPDAKKDKALLNLEDEEEDEENADSEEDDDVIFKDLGSKEVAPEHKESSSIPKQYSKKDMKRLRKQQAQDDDDTI